MYIAASLDGYIADKEGGLSFLNDIPNPEGSDFGFSEFMHDIDAILMGRCTFEAVVGFEGEWPYNKPVYVLSKTLNDIPENLKEDVTLVKGDIVDIVYDLNKKGMVNIYVDGGKTIQSFLRKDMIDELIITTIPVLLGGGSPLFGKLTEKIKFSHYKTEVLLDCLIKNYYKKVNK